MNAGAIVGRMLSSYASLESYSDSGVVLTRTQSSDDPNETTFETRFARPNRFKFTWVSHHPYPPLRHITWRSAIWANDENVFAWHMYNTDSSRREVVESLEIAIGGATGVSEGAALTVSSLLLPQIECWSLKDLKMLALLDTEEFEDEPCYHITGSRETFGSCDLWISSRDHLLRKLTYKLRSSSFIEIRRDIKANTALDDYEFEFSN